MIAYIDTSAFMKRFIPEANSDAVDELSQSGTYRLAISSLTVTEFRSVIKRRVGEGSIDSVFANKAVSQLLEEIASGALRFHAIDAAIFNLAGELIDKLTVPLGTLDALHLACAKATGAEVMISSDRQLLRAASTSDMQIIDFS